MKTPFDLTLWQKKQATLLYHFASLDDLADHGRRIGQQWAEKELIMATPLIPQEIYLLERFCSLERYGDMRDARDMQRRSMNRSMLHLGGQPIA
jgi:hypothetical protein